MQGNNNQDRTENASGRQQNQTRASRKSERPPQQPPQQPPQDQPRAPSGSPAVTPDPQAGALTAEGHTHSVQQKLESIRTKGVPDPQNIFQKYAAEGVTFSMVRLSFEFATERVSHSTFCQSIIETFKQLIKASPKTTTRAFKEAFQRKLIVFKKVVAEFTCLNDSIANVFDFVVLVLGSMNALLEFEEAQKWLLHKLTELITEKFHNSEIILIENVR